MMKSSQNLKTKLQTDKQTYILSEQLDQSMELVDYAICMTSDQQGLINGRCFLASCEMMMKTKRRKSDTNPSDHHHHHHSYNNVII